MAYKSKINFLPPTGHPGRGKMTISRRLRRIQRQYRIANIFKDR